MAVPAAAASDSAPGEFPASEWMGAAGEGEEKQEGIKEEEEKEGRKINKRKRGGKEREGR